MKNKSISDFVANSMEAVLNSESHKSLFKLPNKLAFDPQQEAPKDKHDVACAMCGSMADDEHSCYADDGADEDLAEDSGEDLLSSDMTASAALDVVVNNLLTASAVLDALNMESKSTLSLKLASLVVNAKKRMDSKEKKELLKRLNKGKKPAKSSKEKSSKQLKSKDFKEMLKKDDDGKLTSKNFKAHKVSK